MALKVNHSKVLLQTDSADTTIARPSDWNADHGLSGQVLYSELGGTPPTDTSRVAKAGDTMTGGLVISYANPNLVLSKAASGQVASVYGEVSGTFRWSIELGGAAAETGSNAGSNFNVNRYSDAGALLDVPFSINRQNGMVGSWNSFCVGQFSPPGDCVPNRIIFGNSHAGALGFNCYYNGTVNKYIGADYASVIYALTDGSLNMALAPAGTAGGTATFTPVFQALQSGAVQFPGGVATVSSPASGASLNLSGPAGNYRQISFQTAGSTRWTLFTDTTAESGGNAGSNFGLNSYTDAGAYLGTPFTISRVTGQITASSNVVSNGGLVGCTGAGAAGIGYVDSSGAGGSTTQATSKTTAVTMNTLSGQILLAAGSIAANSAVQFTLNNSKIAADDILLVQHVVSGTLGAYNITATPATGSATITIRNLTTAALNEQFYIRFFLLKCALG
jgi:hypothetical protein